jgi:hypothetical protein
LAVAGVQEASRQQNSLVPFFQIRLPSPFFQLSWLEGPAIACAAAEAAIGAASAAAAKSIATLFSFFIESPLKGMPQRLRIVQIGSEKTWQTPGLTSAHRRSIHCARASPDLCILSRSR